MQDEIAIKAAFERYRPSDARGSIRGMAKLCEQFPERMDAIFGDLIAGTENSERSAAHSILLASAWLRSGMPSVVMPHRYAVALMATDCDGVDELIMPWPCFEIVIPQGIVQLSWGQAAAIMVGRTEAPSSPFYVQYIFEGRERIVTCFRGLAEMKSRALSWADGEAKKGESTVDGGEVSRALTMMNRLFVNVTMAIADASTERAGIGASRVLRRDRNGAPAPTTIKLGKPLAIDCRQSVRDYIAGTRKGGAPSVTTLVRGHWRNQTHGPLNTLRRRQWIQPFYRGEGPLLVRPVKLGGSQ